MQLFEILNAILIRKHMQMKKVPMFQRNTTGIHLYIFLGLYIPAKQLDSAKYISVNNVVIISYYKIKCISS